MTSALRMLFLHYTLAQINRYISSNTLLLQGTFATHCRVYCYNCEWHKSFRAACIETSKALLQSRCITMSKALLYLKDSWENQSALF